MQRKSIPLLQPPLPLSLSSTVQKAGQKSARTDNVPTTLCVQTCVLYFLYPSLFFKSLLRTKTFYQDPKIKSFTKLSKNQVWKTQSSYLHNPFRPACFLSLCSAGRLHKATERNSDIYSPVVYLTR